MTPDEVKRDSQVLTAIKKCADNKVMLFTLIDKLRERLSPLLLSSTPQIEEDKKETIEKVSLAIDIEKFATDFRDASNEISDLLKRLEI